MSDPLFFWGINVGVFLAQKCGHFSARFSNLNIANFDRTFFIVIRK